MFDFDSIVNRIFAYLSAKEEHKNIFEDSAYTSLIESFAQELEFYYTAEGYHTRENQWKLARNKSSLLAQSDVHGYVPPRKISSRGFVKFGVSENFNTFPSNTVNIPKYTQFSNGGDIQFVSDNDYQMTTGDVSIDVGVVQGIYRSETFISTGIDYEEFQVTNSSIENSFFEVFVNGITYTKVDTLLDYTSTDPVYIIENFVDLTGISIKFGNGVFGKKLNSGDTIVFKYVETLGLDGNIVGVGIVDTVESVIYDINNDQVDDVFCTNESGIAGGAEEASLEEIRTQSPRVFQTGDRAVSKTDYISILEDLSYVKKVNVWGAYETNIDNGVDPWTFIESDENVVKVAIITESNENVSDAQKSQILEDINPNKSPTDIISFQTVDFINLIFNISAFVVNSSYSLTDVKANLELEVSEEYSIDNLSFEQNLYESDYKRFIDSVDGIKYHNTYISLYKELSFSAPYTLDIQLPIYPIDPETIKVYVKLISVDDYTLVATGDSVGDLIAESGYNTDDSNINKNTGEGALLINSGLSDPYEDYEVRIEYQSTSNDLLLNSRKDIFQYAESRITIQYARS